MIIISSKPETVRDINAKFTGEFLEVKRISAWSKDDYGVPSDYENNCVPKEPCIMVEVIDEKLSTAEDKVLKPIAWQPITQEVYNFLKEHGKDIFDINESTFDEDFPK